LLAKKKYPHTRKNVVKGKWWTVETVTKPKWWSGPAASLHLILSISLLMSFYMIFEKI
jgi:hypothetical protein